MRRSGVFAPILYSGLMTRIAVCGLILAVGIVYPMTDASGRGSSREGTQGSGVASAESSPIHADPAADQGASGHLSLSPYSNALPPDKSYLRTAIEIAAFLGISAGYYYATLGDPKAYEFDGIEDSLRARFVTGEAYLLDNNSWDSNVGHIAAGTGYYLLARSNDLSLAQSLLATVTASTVWELFGELQDEVSINDSVMTPLGGFAIGESMHQLGEFFQHSSPTIPNRVLGFLFGPSAAIHRWVDGRTPSPPSRVDQFGFTTDAWHRFRLYAGGGGSDSSDTGKHRTEMEMGIDLEVVTADQYGKAGQSSGFYLDGAFNQMSAHAALDGSEVVDFSFFARTAFWGYYQQDIGKYPVSKNLEGHSLNAGLASAFEYYAHQYSDAPYEDKQVVCDLVGPILISDYHHCGLHLRTIAEVYPNFSMVKPGITTLDNTFRRRPGTKSVFRFEDYYFALGLTAGAKLEADYGPFGLQAQARYYLFDSIDGLDRFSLDRFRDNRAYVDNEYGLKDERLWLQWALYYDLPIQNLKLMLNLEKIFRWSDIDNSSWSTDENRYTARLVFEF